MKERAKLKEITGRPSLHILARAAVAVVLAPVAFLGWHLVRNNDVASTRSEITAAAMRRGPGTDPVAVSEKALKTFAAVLGEPVYRVGPRPGYRYSLRQTPDGQFYIRYLPSGVRVGGKRPNLLVVATYPLRDAFAATEKTAKREGGLVLRIARGGVAYFPERSPATVYLAYPESNYQVEFFDPSPRARKLIVSGRIARVR